MTKQQHLSRRTVIALAARASFSLAFLVARTATAQMAELESPKAKSVVALVDKAAALVGSKGKAAFERQCAICHTVEKGGDNRLGPNLFGIIGKKAGTAPDYTYTNAFKTRANWEWTEDAIGGWMMFPSTMIPGTAMGIFQGIAERDRDDLVAYLATLK